jgi:carboxyl-terminal processing protease
LFQADGARPSAASSPLLELSASDRRDDLEIIWKAIQERYYDPAFNGVNWDAVRERYRPMVDTVKTDDEFYDLMERMVNELHDSHTHVLSPALAQSFRKHERMSLGFDYEVLDGKLVVVRVTEGSQADKAGVKPGMIVKSVDGQPLAARVAEVAARFPESSTPRATQLLRYFHVFAGDSGSTIKLVFERTEGSFFEATLTRENVPVTPELVAKLLPSGNAYIRFNVFLAPAAKEFKDALKKFQGAPGLIIDLRRNPGGTSEELNEIAASFFATRTLLASYRTRTSDLRPVYVGGKTKQLYSRPVVILTEPLSGSSSELFAAGMQDTGRSKIVGSQTCGCVLGWNDLFELKGGGAITISSMLWFTPHDRKLEGEGVIPDRVAAITLADLREKRDPVLAAGDALLKEMSPDGLREPTRH